MFAFCLGQAGLSIEQLFLGAACLQSGIAGLRRPELGGCPGELGARRLIVQLQQQLAWLGVISFVDQDALDRG